MESTTDTWDRDEGVTSTTLTFGTGPREHPATAISVRGIRQRNTVLAMVELSEGFDFSGRSACRDRSAASTAMPQDP
jgi:hypothetical protein